MVSKKSVGLSNRKRFDVMSKEELERLINSLDRRRDYLCYLLTSKFKA